MIFRRQVRHDRWREARQPGVESRTKWLSNSFQGLAQKSLRVCTSAILSSAGPAGAGIRADGCDSVLLPVLSVCLAATRGKCEWEFARNAERKERRKERHQSSGDGGVSNYKSSRAKQESDSRRSSPPRRHHRSSPLLLLSLLDASVSSAVCRSRSSHASCRHRRG